MSKQHLSSWNNLKFDPSDVAEGRKIFRNVDDTLSYSRMCTDRGCPCLSAHPLLAKAYRYFKPPPVTHFRKEDSSIIFPAFIN